LEGCFTSVLADELLVYRFEQCFSRQIPDLLVRIPVTSLDQCPHNSLVADVRLCKLFQGLQPRVMELLFCRIPKPMQLLFNFGRKKVSHLAFTPREMMHQDSKLKSHLFTHHTRASLLGNCREGWVLWQFEHHVLQFEANTPQELRRPPNASRKDNPLVLHYL